MADTLELFVLTALWGNRMDLSLWPAGGERARQEDAFGDALKAGEAALLVRGRSCRLSHARSRRPRRRPVAAAASFGHVVVRAAAGSVGQWRGEGGVAL